MSDVALEFDPAPFADREQEVLAVFAQHLAALDPQNLSRLQDEGAVLINLAPLETGDLFALTDLKVALVEAGDSIENVEAHFGLVWISSFRWLRFADSEAESSLANGSPSMTAQGLLARLLEFDWFELVLWELEERWIHRG